MAVPHSHAARIFGERVRSARIELGLSQESVADLAQMHVTNLGKIERGCANPSLHTIVRIAGVLGVDVGHLTDGIKAAHLPEELQVFSAAEFLRARSMRR